MFKKLALVGAGTLLFISPLVASAQSLEEMRAQLENAIAFLQSHPQGQVLGAATDDTPDGGTTDSVYCPQLSQTLRRGMRDTQTVPPGQVSELQTFLTDYYSLDENIVVGGYFGRLTQKYVMQFQQEQGLPSYGIVGSLTRAKIKEVCGNPSTEANALIVSPTFGPAPLTVSFSHNQIPSDNFLDFGDGSPLDTSGGKGGWANHVYTAPGTYHAVLRECTLHVSEKDCDASRVIGTAVITVTGPGTKCGVNTFSVTNRCGDGLTRNAYFQCYDGYDQALGDATSCKPLSVWQEYARNACANRCATANGITITAPNGGEQWEEGVMNTVTWTPYNYNPDINPSKDVTAYLERKSGDIYSVLGKVEEDGKASIHWSTGLLDSRSSGPSTWVSPGQYYIRVMNNVTQAYDRSDAPFTILPRSVDLKVNGSDGPVTIDPSQKVWITWNSTGKDVCYAYGVSDVQPPSGGTSPTIRDLPTSGKREVYVWFYDPSYGTSISMQCNNSSSGQIAYDQVGINVVPQSASLTITSPNGGEQIPLTPPPFTSPTHIFWSQSGISRVSIALYKNDQWKQWLVKDMSAASDSKKNSFLFDPLTISDAPGLPAMGNVFKIYITGQKNDGSGYVDDKSDAPFSFQGTVPSTMPISVTPTSGQTPLKVTLSFGLGSLCDSYTVFWGNGSSVGPSQGCSPVSTITLDNTYFLPNPYAATYVITVKNNTTGQSASQSVTVLPGPAPTFNFVNPPFDWVLAPGDQATIRWNASPPSGRPMSAYKVSFSYILEGSPYGDGVDAGWVPLSANQAVWNIRQDLSPGTYRLRATIIEEGPSGAPIVAEVTSNPFAISLDRYRVFSVQPVGGTAPVTVTATFQLSSSCTPYTLTWGDGQNSSYTGPPAGTSCTAVVPPPSSISHTYTLAGTYLVIFQPQGQPFVSKTVDVYAPPAVSMSINGQSAVTLPAGSTFTIVWSSTNATSCTITNAQGQTGSTPPNVSGSSQGAVPAAGQTYTYKIACTNAYGTTSQTATVTGQ